MMLDFLEVLECFTRLGGTGRGESRFFFVMPLSVLALGRFRFAARRSETPDLMGAASALGGGKLETP